MAAGSSFAADGRKVRTPPDGVPANGRAARADGQCHRKDTAYVPSGAGKGEMVR